MPVIPATKITSIGAVDATETTLNGTDSFVYVPGVTRFLILRNDSGGPLSPVIDGDGSVSEYLPGVGNVSTASGFAVGSIADGAIKVVDLTSISSYLKGAIAITSGTGLSAILASV